ncbi:MAG: hypothetical protein IPG70_08590 [Moraxellaceae bacterium]|nr:hypothetical protein [Moraxellaceae bacterium]
MPVCRAKRKADIDYFAITQPDAFSLANNSFANTYSGDVATVLQKICTETGMKLQNPAPVVVSETAAARHMAQVTSDESFVVIDMGGGTTDIAIHLCCKNSLDGQPSIQKLQLTSSIKWAGNALLSALIASGNSQLRLYLISQLDGLGSSGNKDEILSALLKS